MRGSSNSSRNSSILKNSSRMLDRSLLSVNFFLFRVKNLSLCKTPSQPPKSAKLALRSIMIMEMLWSGRNMILSLQPSKAVERRTKSILMSCFLQFKPLSFPHQFIEKVILVELKMISSGWDWAKFSPEATKFSAKKRQVLIFGKEKNAMPKVILLQVSMPSKIAPIFWNLSSKKKKHLLMGFIW